MKKQIFSIFLLFISLFLITAGCDLVNITPGPEYTIEIRTEKEIYTLPTGEQSHRTPSQTDSGFVYYSAVNLGPGSVYYLSPWHVQTLEKKKNGEWTNLGAWYGYIGIPPSVREFAPGDTLIPIELRLNHEIIDGPGMYRFLFELYTDGDLESLLPIEHRISNTFEIREK